jgi:diadenosine tetraphosphate (Ap4A) HIT family hydrolase
MAKNNCLFCDSNNAELIEENDLCYSRKDGYPVTPRHTLIIPKRHVASYFDLYDREVKAMHQMLIEMKNKIQGYDETVSGFNIGVNAGEDAGQSIFHVHMHLIPRRKGDIDNPQGGVRGVIPNRRTYTRKFKESQ